MGNCERIGRVRVFYAGNCVKEAGAHDERVPSSRGQLREGPCAGNCVRVPCVGNCVRTGAIESSARETGRERVSSILRAGNREKERARVELEVESSGRETNRKQTASTRDRIIVRATVRWSDFERLRTESSRGQPGGGAVRRRRLCEGYPLGNQRKAERRDSRPKSSGG